MNETSRRFSSHYYTLMIFFTRMIRQNEYANLFISKFFCVSVICMCALCALFSFLLFNEYSEAKIDSHSNEYTQNSCGFLSFSGSFFMDQYSVHKFVDLSRFIHKIQDDHLSYLAENCYPKNAKHIARVKKRENKHKFKTQFLF